MRIARGTLLLRESVEEKVERIEYDGQTDNEINSLVIGFREDGGYIAMQKRDFKMGSVEVRNVRLKIPLKRIGMFSLYLVNIIICAERRDRFLGLPNVE
ncbi:hypothetical protein [Paenibacillus haidiansis]|uniref:hypothetical protein n=1 Tax=Paenibacillus haidiansis TaxID=1574488 RepID=UPI0039DFBCED